MKALIRKSRSPGDVGIEDIEVPKPSSGQILIKVVFAGVCMTDVYNTHRLIPPEDRLQPPVVIGHEGAGWVAEVGPDVKKYPVGSPVTSETTFSTCQKCIYCKSGRLNLCPERKSLGSTADGFFSEYLLVPETSVHHLGPLSLEEGAILEPLACATHAIFEQGQLEGGETVCVFGPGIMGLFIVQLLKLIGCRVYLVCTSHSLPRIKVVESKYIDRVINKDKDNVPAVIDSTGFGVDCVIECSGSLGALSDALDILSPGGSLLTVGEYKEPLSIDLSSILVAREIVLKGSRSSTPSSWQIALKYARERKIEIRPLITDKFEIEDWEKGFDQVKKKEGIKSLLVL